MQATNSNADKQTRRRMTITYYGHDQCRGTTIFDGCLIRRRHSFANSDYPFEVTLYMDD